MLSLHKSFSYSRFIGKELKKNRERKQMVLFTGLTGTSGSALVDVLQKHGFSEHFRVLVRKTSNLTQLENSGLDYETAYGSLNDAQSLVSAMTGCDTVFHIAAKGKLKEIANAAVESKTVRKCILVSSTSVYSSYRKTSYLAEDEKIIKPLLEQNGISWVLIRPTMIYGTLEDRNISQFMKWIDKYPIFPLVKKGRALLQPVYRYDIAEAFYLLLTNRDACNCEEFIVSGKEPLSLKELLETIGASLGKKTRFINVPFWAAQGGVNILYYLSRKKVDFREKLFRLTEDRAFDHTAISERFGYEPGTFEEGVSQLSALYKNREKKQ